MRQILSGLLKPTVLDFLRVDDFCSRKIDYYDVEAVTSLLVNHSLLAHEYWLFTRCNAASRVMAITKISFPWIHFCRIFAKIIYSRHFIGDTLSPVKERLHKILFSPHFAHFSSSWLLRITAAEVTPTASNQRLMGQVIFVLDYALYDISFSMHLMISLLQSCLISAFQFHETADSGCKRTGRYSAIARLRSSFHAIPSQFLRAASYSPILRRHRAPLPSTVFIRRAIYAARQCRPPPPFYGRYDDIYAHAGTDDIDAAVEIITPIFLYLTISLYQVWLYICSSNLPCYAALAF